MYKPIIIRLAQRGQNKYKLFNIVVVNKDRARRGGHYECIGFVNPQIKEKMIFLDSLRLAIWLNKGAKLHKSLFKHIYNICH
jgi:small subunit ribosomal protein S16